MDTQKASSPAAGDRPPQDPNVARSPSGASERDVGPAVSDAGHSAGATSLLEFMVRRVSGTVWTTDAELRFTSSFGGSLQELNLQPNEAVGKSLYEYFETTDEAFPAIEAHRRALAGEGVDFEIHWAGRHFQTRVEPLRGEAGEIIGCVGYSRDVTEHDQLVHALRASERQYRQLAESMTDYVFLADHQGTLQYVNRSAAECFGVPPTTLHGKHQHDLFPPDLVSFHLASIQRVVQSGAPIEVDEAIPLGPDTVWLNVRLIPLRDERGQVASVMGVCRDISDRRRAEETRRQAHQKLEREVKRRTADLRRANEQLQHEVEVRRQAENRLSIFERFAEAAGQIFWMADLDTRITYVNAFGCLLLGDRPDQIQGRSFLDFYGESERKRLETDVLPQVLADGKWTGETAISTPAGIHLEGLQHLFLVRDNQAGELRFATVVTDITSLRAAQEALRHSEERYRTLVEACPDAVVMFDPEPRVTFASQRALELYGVDAPTQLIGRRLDELIAEPERPRLRANLPGLLQEGTRRTVEYTLCRHDGTAFAGEISAAVVRDTQGRPLVLIAVIRDVTERRLVHEALEQERQNLWHMLRSSDHERQLISYEIHDGLAQELAGALLQLQSFEYQRDRNPERAQEAFEAGLAALRQAHFEARRLIGRVRPPILDEYGIDAALSHLVAEKSRTAEPRLEYECHVAFNRLAPILENTLYRIAQEALSNACKHSGSREVRMSLSQEGESVCLAIRDWGVGFDPQTVARQRFGLRGIQERTRMLGGQLTIDSEPGQGTWIRVVLPLLEREESTAEDA
ncbi:MAG: PAS domain S-box protein [Candidatus Anammoximicrobium sp.]|nr:PAS domain S-box protein [Candidatus Anammoximicrobium sp.]